MSAPAVSSMCVVVMTILTAPAVKTHRALLRRPRSATFPVATNSVSNSQSATIVGTIGGDWATHKYAIITVWTPFHYANGSISILPGGGGSGRVTSQPAGIDCTITRGNGAGSCSAFYPVGTIVRLEARPAPDSKPLRWSTNLPGCSDPSRVRIARGTNITC